MLFYLFITVVLIAVLVASITDCRNNTELLLRQKIYFSKPIYNMIFIALIAFFWFLTAFRSSEIGNDTLQYLNYYDIIARNGVNENFQIELGYQYFCLFLSKITPDPYFILTVSSTVCYVISGIYIYRNSNNILFSAILLFCVAFPFFASGVRQSISMAIVLIAYEQIKKGKKVIPIILILFASLFHVSALMALLWFAHRFIPKRVVVVISIALVVSVLAAMGSLNAMLASILKEYENYFESEYAGSGWLGIVYYALRATVFYLFIYLSSKGNENEYSLEVSNAVLLLFTVCLGFSVNLFSRASLYFLLVTAIDIPNSLNSGKIKNRDFWMLLIGIVMLAYFMLTLIARPEWNQLYPYKFRWD